MKKLTMLFLSVIIFAVFFIISKDLGEYSSKPGGAGEIWWTQVPVIESTYQEVTTK